MVVPVQALRVAEGHRAVVGVGRRPAAGLCFEFAEPGVLLAAGRVILGQAIALSGRLIDGITLLDLSQTHPNTDLLAERLMVRPGNDVAVRVRNCPD